MPSRTLPSLITLLLVTLAAAPAAAQYNASAGRSAPAPAPKRVKAVDDVTGEVSYEYKEVEVERDGYGNASSSDYDLAIDGAFEGQTVVVLQIHRATITEPWEVLRRKGFSVYRFQGVPSPKQLAEALGKANQLWVIAGCHGQELNEEHLAPIKEFFDAGHGVYIWGDNDPCYADANLVARHLLDAEMKGNVPGDRTISLKTKESPGGVLPDHLLSTGLEYIYEGITIATIQPNAGMTPFIWGSAGNLVASFYDRQGKRAILDGGFTRLYYKWDTAGTDRYIANAAAWLANYERFGDAVVAEEHRGDDAREPGGEGETSPRTR